MQGTDLDWFRRLRAATELEITAAGGITTLDDIRALDAMHIHAAVGMAIYTGRLDLEQLASSTYQKLVGSHISRSAESCASTSQRFNDSATYRARAIAGVFGACSG